MTREQIEALVERVVMSATATVENNFGEATITPDPVEYDSAQEAIEGLREWAEGGFWPAQRPIKSLSVEIRAIAHTKGTEDATE